MAKGPSQKCNAQTCAAKPPDRFSEGRKQNLFSWLGGVEAYLKANNLPSEKCSSTILTLLSESAQPKATGARIEETSSSYEEFHVKAVTLLGTPEEVELPVQFRSSATVARRGGERLCIKSARTRGESLWRCPTGSIKGGVNPPFHSGVFQHGSVRIHSAVASYLLAWLSGSDSSGTGQRARSHTRDQASPVRSW